MSTYIVVIYGERSMRSKAFNNLREAYDFFYLYQSLMTSKSITGIEIGVYEDMNLAYLDTKFCYSRSI